MEDFSEKMVSNLLRKSEEINLVPVGLGKNINVAVGGNHEKLKKLISRTH